MDDTKRDLGLHPKWITSLILQFPRRERRIESRRSVEAFRRPLVDTSRRFPQRVAKTKEWDTTASVKGRFQTGWKSHYKLSSGSVGVVSFCWIHERARSLHEYVNPYFRIECTRNRKPTSERNVPRCRPLLPRNWFISSLDLSPWAERAAFHGKKIPRRKVRQPKSRSTFTNARRLDLDDEMLVFTIE